MHRKHQPKLFEGLRAKDLKDQVDHIFTIDQYKSKMGEDKDIVVLGFRVSDKYPATDLMEFIEKSYNFILDADMSTGEERDGRYQVFVELERNKHLGKQIAEVLDGLSKLCDCKDWKFRYFKDIKSLDFSEEAVNEHVPCSPEEYENKLVERKNETVAEFFDQGATETNIDKDNNLTISKPYSGNLNLSLLELGDYETIKESLQGAVQLDESSRSQVVFLEKYLGNYEIHKISDKFLIRNGNKAAVVQLSKGQ